MRPRFGWWAGAVGDVLPVDVAPEVAAVGAAHPCWGSVFDLWHHGFLHSARRFGFADRMDMVTPGRRADR